MRATVAVCLIAVAGCGPTPQERYNTALSILEQERVDLQRARPGYVQAMDDAAQAVVRDIAGASSQDMLNEARKSLEEDRANPPQGFQAVIDSTEEHIARERDFTARSKPVHEATMKTLTPGTPEFQRVEKLAAADARYKAYQQQLARVERATKAVNEAESALPNR